MANIDGPGFKRWDTLAGAAFAVATPPARPRVKSIIIVAGATGGTTTFTVDGKTWLSIAVPADAVLSFDFAEGQYMPGLALSALGTNVIVTVNYA